MEDEEDDIVLFDGLRGATKARQQRQQEDAESIDLLHHQSSKWKVEGITKSEKTFFENALHCVFPTPIYMTPLLFFKGLMSYIGSIVFWVGAWGVFSQEQKGDNEEEVTDSLFPKTRKVQIIFLIFGSLLTMAMDSFYGNMGLDSPLNPRETLVPNMFRWWSNQSKSLTYVLYGLRIFLGFIGSFLLWIAAYNILDVYLFDFTLKYHISCIFIGLALLVISGTVFCMACIFPIDSDNRRQVREFDDVSKFEFSLEAVKDYVVREFIPFIRACTSLVGQNLIWVGGFNILEYYSDPSLGREIAYAIVGIFLFFLTDSFLANSFIDYKGSSGAINTAEPSQADRVVSIVFYFRCLFVIAGQVMSNTGIWVLLDEYTVESTYGRDIVCLIVGFAMIALSGTICTNCGIMPPKYVSLASIHSHDEPVSHVFHGQQYLILNSNPHDVSRGTQTPPFSHKELKQLESDSNDSAMAAGRSPLQSNLNSNNHYNNNKESLNPSDSQSLTSNTRVSNTAPNDDSHGLDADRNMPSSPQTMEDDQSSSDDPFGQFHRHDAQQNHDSSI